MAAKTYRVAVIGRTKQGDYGHAVDTAFLAFADRTKVVAVADEDEAGRAAAVKRLGLDAAAGHADWRKMLDDVKPDIVAVCQRWVDAHGEMILAAAERGIHVFAEKPFVRSPEEADRIVDAAARTHSRIAIAHPTHYSPVMATVVKLLAAGELGTVVELRGRGKEDRRGGGEDLWVLGSHIMNMARTLGGAAKWCFGEVTAAGKRIVKADVKPGAEGIGPLAGDTVHAMFGLASGAAYHFDSVRNAGGRESRFGLQLFTTKGVLSVVEGILGHVQFLPDPTWGTGKVKPATVPVTSAGVGKPEPLAGPHYTSRHGLAILDLLDAIEKHREPACGPAEGRAIIEMITAVFESHRLGRPVDFPLKTRGNPLTLLE